MRHLTKEELDTLAPKIAEDLRTMKGNNVQQRIANTYKIDVSLVRSIAKTRKTGIVENETLSDIPSNDTGAITTEVVAITEEKEENVEEKKTRKPAVFLTDEQKNEICNYFFTGEMSQKDLAEMYNVTAVTVSRIIMAKKSEKTPSGRKKPVPINESIINRVIDLYNDGKDRKQIESLCGISHSSVARILKNASEKGAIELTRRVSNKKKNTYKGNKHQAEKAKKEFQAKYMSDWDNPFEEEEKEETTEVVNTIAPVIIEAAKSVYSDEIEFCGKHIVMPEIKRLVRPISDDFVTVGTIADRHDMPVEEYIFDHSLTSSEKRDIAWQLSVVDKYITDHFEFDINGNATKTMNLYCTGLQSVLGSIFRTCLLRHVNLNQVNYVDGSYISQVIIDQFGESVKIADYPFEKMKENLYTYDCTLDEISSNEDLYAISLNNHVGYKNSIDHENSSIVIFNDINKLWSFWPKVVQMVEDNRGVDNNSAMAAHLYTFGNKFTWGDNFSKSRNYK